MPGIRKILENEGMEPMLVITRNPDMAFAGYPIKMDFEEDENGNDKLDMTLIQCYFAEKDDPMHMAKIAMETCKKAADRMGDTKASALFASFITALEL